MARYTTLNRGFRHVFDLTDRLCIPAALHREPRRHFAFFALRLSATVCTALCVLKQAYADLHHPVLGDHAQTLLLDAHRSLQTRTLIPYNTESVRAVIREAQSLGDSLTELYDAYGHPPYSPYREEAVIKLLALNRNHRNHIIYHQQRLDTLKDRFWEKGGMLSAAFGAETDTRKHMTTADEGFAKSYAELCMKLKTSYYEDADEPGTQGPQMMDAFDLLGGGVEAAPPKDVFVTVRVLKDVGDVETVSGARLTLTKGSQYSLAREDIENMIVQGFVEIIE